MSKGKRKAEVIDLEGLLAWDEHFAGAAVETVVVDTEVTTAIGAAKVSGARR